MKIHSVLASLFLLFGVAFSNPTSRRPPVRNQVETVDSLLGEAVLGVREAWEKFKNEHGKQYSESEDKSRFFAFLDAKSFADTQNKKFARGEARFHVGTNRISDLSPHSPRLPWIRVLFERLLFPRATPRGDSGGRRLARGGIRDRSQGPGHLWELLGVRRRRSP
ncbi:hypothetical protein L596_016296 [Steinernema carpocapsae]|uniref:Cathepsin propeptide inhibitor domain-containing protein n=1 Tax=Steinernema carpocapsae TaxID=34508 RepID=A0A4U5NHK7_STECR|nr:hypothetical protein L596_016296 [Steinernema carpocapsae]